MDATVPRARRKGSRKFDPRKAHYALMCRAALLRAIGPGGENAEFLTDWRPAKAEQELEGWEQLAEAVRIMISSYRKQLDIEDQGQSAALQGARDLPGACPCRAGSRACPHGGMTVVRCGHAPGDHRRLP